MTDEKRKTDQKDEGKMKQVIRFANEAKAWRRRKKLNDLLETLNNKMQ